MIDLLKISCIIIALTCCVAIGYAIWQAIETSKRNRASEEMSRQIFLSQILQNKNENGTNCQVQYQPAQQTPQVKKSLNYDEFENDVDLSKPSDKSLKDFYSET